MGYNDKTTMRDLTQQVGFDIVSSEKFVNGCLDSFLYSTLKSHASLGLY